MGSFSNCFTGLREFFFLSSCLDQATGDDVYDYDFNDEYDDYDDYDYDFDDFEPPSTLD